MTVATSGGDHQLDQARAALAEARVLLADSELRVAREHELALRLQRAVMPPDVGLMAAAGVSIAARCLPPTPAALGAGDWYDALLLPGGDLLLVVGDIAGHGLDAVAGMVLARNALRGLAPTGADPAQLIGRLNQATCRLADEVTGTVICARYRPRHCELRWARAGHLPPVLVRDGHATVQPMPEGCCSACAPESAYEQLRLPLRSGDTLLFYTDGLIERRAASISDALAEFAAAAVPVGPDLDAHVTRILATAVSDTGDDACLLAVRVR